MIYGLIICAGKQSRFKSDLPKALIRIDGQSLLQKNIEEMKSYCNKIAVICSTENESYFTDEEIKDAQKVTIVSGKGSGDAVWQALHRLDVKPCDTCFILWGDCLQRNAIYRKITESYRGIFLIPCTVEEKPYVQITETERGGAHASFSKFGEPIGSGFHDLSLFYGNALSIRDKLDTFHDKICDDQGNYKHKHGNEMEFLDIINETDILVDILVFENYKEFAFNTVEQLQQLLEKK